MGSLWIHGVWSALNRPVISVHPLFWVMMLLAILTGQFVQVIVFFLVVTLHELGHILAARSFHWRIQSIELLPFGGVAHVEEWGNTTPLSEVVVALSGPLVNVLLYFLGKGLGITGLIPREWAAFFMYSNVLVGGFNLLPIWPLDGGRVLHTVYSLFLPYRQSVLLSIHLSFIGALLLVFWSIRQPVIHVNGLGIAFYLLFSNIMSYRLIHYQFLRFLLARYHEMENLPTQFPIRKVVVPGSMTVQKASKKIKRGCYQQFQIGVEGNDEKHYVMERELLTCFFEKTPHCAMYKLIR